MKRALLLSILVCSSLWSTAQELLVPVSGAAPRTASPAVLRPAAKAGDTLRLTLPFFDDFAAYEGAPDSRRWLTDDAFVNKDFGILPPTVGVATLDALNGAGTLHAGAGTASFGGDTLASQKIRLDSVFSPQGRRLQPSDSIYLSFYYSPGGGYGDMWARLGDAPEGQDSLILECYNATAGSWQRLWSRGGTCADTLLATTGAVWQWVAVAITDASLLNADFQFRFRNLCSMDPTSKTGMAANCDQWNLDCILLNRGRGWHDSLARDIAFVDKAPSLLARYQAMPARQFADAEMAQQITMTITNRYSQTLSSHYAYYLFNAQGHELERYDGGSENITPYAQGHAYQTVAAHATPPVNFAYSLSGSTRQTFTVMHVVSEGFSGDAYPQNDTLRFTQVFDNYFAYDDGVPENGYGLTSTSSRMDMAVRFGLNVADTLTALDLYFNRTRGDENVGIGFTLCVWDEADSLPGTLRYQDGQTRYVRADSLGALVRYRLSAPVALPAGTYFIGLEQSSKDYINLGFDRSRNVSGQNFYRTGSEWQQSILNGALLLRPCFGMRATLDIVENTAPAFSLYPNPAHDVLHVSLPDAEEASAYSLQLYDAQGRLRYAGTCRETLSVSAYPAGLYLLRLRHNASGRSTTQKIILR